MGGRSTEREERSQASPSCTSCIDITYLPVFLSLGLKSPRELGHEISAGVGVAESIHVAKQKPAAMCQIDLMTKKRFCSILSTLTMHFCMLK